MNQQDLELAKKIAEIEGVDYDIEASDSGIMFITHYYMGDPMCSEYNPFDWSILGPLMLKHGVSLIQNGNGDNHMFFMGSDNDIDICVTDKQEIPRTILECIVKSQEK